MRLTKLLADWEVHHRSSGRIYSSLSDNISPLKHRLRSLFFFSGKNYKVWTLGLLSQWTKSWYEMSLEAFRHISGLMSCATLNIHPNPAQSSQGIWKRQYLTEHQLAIPLEMRRRGGGDLSPAFSKWQDLRSTYGNALFMWIHNSSCTGGKKGGF